jgi:DNA polymerase III sliding clamp (beta) subunit (PCNA family)
MTDVVTMDPKLLAKVLRIMRMHASKEEARPHLCATVIDSDERGVRMTSTDGHRLATYILTETPLAWRGRTALSPSARRMLRSLCLAARGISVDIDLGARTARTHDLTFGWESLDLHYPEYEKIIPKEALLPSSAVLDPKYVRDACRAFDSMAEVKRAIAVRTGKDHPLEVVVFLSPYVKDLMILVMPMRTAPGWDNLPPFQAPLDRFTAATTPEAAPAPEPSP